MTNNRRYSLELVLFYENLLSAILNFLQYHFHQQKLLLHYIKVDHRSRLATMSLLEANNLFEIKVFILLFLYFIYIYFYLFYNTHFGNFYSS